MVLMKFNLLISEMVLNSFGLIQHKFRFISIQRVFWRSEFELNELKRNLIAELKPELNVLDLFQCRQLQFAVSLLQLIQ